MASLKSFRKLIRESFQKMLLNENSLTNSPFVFNIQTVDTLLDKWFIKNRGKTASAFDNLGWRLQHLSDLFGQNQDTNLIATWQREFQAIEHMVNQELIKIQKKIGPFFYNSVLLAESIMSHEEMDANDLFPLLVYVSATGQSGDEIGVMIHPNGKYEMFEENEESTPETDQKINELLGLSNKKVRIFGNHGESIVNQIRQNKILPANLYISTDKQHALSHWDMKEGRILFTGIVNMNHIKMESSLDWKTIQATPIEEFRTF